LTICATLDKPDEFMTITVSVPNGPDQLRVRESGVARAKDFAKQFAEPSLGFFPIQDHVIDLPRGKYPGKRLGDQPNDEADHFIRCPACNGLDRLP
jgi:hypothetical protein